MIWRRWVSGLVAPSPPHIYQNIQKKTSWAVQRGYAAIPKSTKPERLAENISVFDFSLSDEEMQQISGLDRCVSGIFVFLRVFFFGRSFGAWVLFMCVLGRVRVSLIHVYSQAQSTNPKYSKFRYNDPGEFCKGMGGSYPIYA